MPYVVTLLQHYCSEPLDLWPAEGWILAGFVQYAEIILGALSLQGLDAVIQVFIRSDVHSCTWGITHMLLMGLPFGRKNAVSG